MARRLSRRLATVGACRSHVLLWCLGRERERQIGTPCCKKGGKQDEITACFWYFTFLMGRFRVAARDPKFASVCSLDISEHCKSYFICWCFSTFLSSMMIANAIGKFSFCFFFHFCFPTLAFAHTLSKQTTWGRTPRQPGGPSHVTERAFSSLSATACLNWQRERGRVGRVAFTVQPRKEIRKRWAWSSA